MKNLIGFVMLAVFAGGCVSEVSDSPSGCRRGLKETHCYSDGTVSVEKDNTATDCEPPSGLSCRRGVKASYCTAPDGTSWEFNDISGEFIHDGVVCK